MADVSFAENLHGGSTHPILAQGCGLLAFVRNGFWMYERHSRDCQPGKWSVSLCAHEARDFWPLAAHRADAVVDDFGDLHYLEARK